MERDQLKAMMASVVPLRLTSLWRLTWRTGKG
jgi:hypothetical protein